MRSNNDTLGNTQFQLISDFFYVNQGVLPPGVCWKGGQQIKEGRNRLSGLVTKQVVEYPQVLASGE